MIDSPWKLAVILAASALVFGLPSYLIGRPKGRGGTGFMLGWLLGIIGLIIIICLRPDREALIRREQDRLRIRQEAAARMDGGIREP